MVHSAELRLVLDEAVETYITSAINTAVTPLRDALAGAEAEIRDRAAVEADLRNQTATLKARVAELEAQLRPGKRCELPVATVTALRGSWVKPGNTNVRVLNEVWNATEAGPQTLKVCDETSWYVEATHPKAGLPKDSGSVKSYPCTQTLFPKTLISSLKSLSLRFAHEAPALGEWNACVDAWVGGLGSASTAEVMVWTDHRYPASIPPSNALKTATLVLGGVTYKAWTRKNSNGGDYIALVANEKRAAGTVDLLAVFKWLQGLGWLKATDTLAAVNYGIEISNTQLTKQVFRMNDCTLTWS